MELQTRLCKIYLSIGMTEARKIEQTSSPRMKDHSSFLRQEGIIGVGGRCVIIIPVSYRSRCNEYGGKEVSDNIGYLIKV